YFQRVSIASELCFKLNELILNDVERTRLGRRCLAEFRKPLCKVRHSCIIHQIGSEGCILYSIKCAIDLWKEIRTIDDFFRNQWMAPNCGGKSRVKRIELIATNRPELSGRDKLVLCETADERKAMNGPIVAGQKVLLRIAAKETRPQRYRPTSVKITR